MTREEAIEVYNGLINTKIKEAFEFFAPELAESEDEKIRKGLIQHLKELRNTRKITNFVTPYQKHIHNLINKPGGSDAPRLFLCNAQKRPYFGLIRVGLITYTDKLYKAKIREFSEK